MKYIYDSNRILTTLSSFNQIDFNSQNIKRRVRHLFDNRKSAT